MAQGIQGVDPAQSAARLVLMPLSAQHLLREEQRKILRAAEDMKASYAAEEMEKRAKRTQMTTASLQDLGYRKKAASAGPSRGMSIHGCARAA